jgi:hypothetical protein
MTPLVPLRFLRSTLPYAPGEVAGFAAKRAEELVRMKAAEYYSPAPEVVPGDIGAAEKPAIRAPRGK